MKVEDCDLSELRDNAVAACACRHSMKQLYRFDTMKELLLKATDRQKAFWSAWYAEHVLGCRWPEAEQFIVRDRLYALRYACNVIEGRWPEAEAIIASNPYTALDYARDVIKGRWSEGEPAIAKSPWATWGYVTEVLKERWPEGESILMRTNFRSRYIERFLEPTEEKPNEDRSS